MARHPSIPENGTKFRRSDLIWAIPAAMSDVLITVENLSKRYMVGHRSAERERYAALRDVLVREARNFARKGLDFFRGRPIVQGDEVEEFWALRDVSFEVRRGEVLGIIGRNGAGKSTLLKILSRITEPDSGRAVLRGRVASLLEVGTGFHPELTGRENIFLNGAILGMTKAEIKAKFDEIVEFAEVERFLDMPVKRYSSGMYVRLAFSVAAHLESEILVVDEVLAVGDADFQKKSLGKMHDVASKQGRTILFVSHNMAAIQNLSETGILLSNGSVVSTGSISHVVERYQAGVRTLSDVSLQHRKDRRGSGALRFELVILRNEDGRPVNALNCGMPGVIELMISNKTGGELRLVQIGVCIYGEDGRRLAILGTDLANEDFPKWPLNTQGVELRLPRVMLAPGQYTYTLFASVNGEIADWIETAGVIEVQPGDFYGTGRLPSPDIQGYFFMPHEFRLRTLP
jgi:lipopolysaccharide transport system ATP-binding protein